MEATKIEMGACSEVWINTRAAMIATQSGVTRNFQVQGTIYKRAHMKVTIKKWRLYSCTPATKKKHVL